MALLLIINYYYYKTIYLLSTIFYLSTLTQSGLSGSGKLGAGRTGSGGGADNRLGGGGQVGDLGSNRCGGTNVVLIVVGN
jgi:hypothetical protein